MPLCINVFGLEVLGDKDCDKEHKDARTDRVEARQGGHTDRVTVRQDDRTERVEDRQEEHTDRVTTRAENNYTPVSDAIGSVGGAIGGIASGLGSGLTGGLLAPLGQVVPIAVAVAGGGLLLYAFTHRKK